MSGKYGEPWETAGDGYLFDGRNFVRTSIGRMESPEVAALVRDCVNACEGFDDLKEMRKLAVYAKILLTNYSAKKEALRGGPMNKTEPCLWFYMEDVFQAARKLGLPEAAMLEET